MLELKKIVIDHNLTLIGHTTGKEGVFYGPTWYYLLAIPFFLSAGDPSGIALFIALSGIATIFLGYLLGRKISGDFLGINLAALLSFSPYMIGLSTQIWNPNLVPFFTVLLLYIVNKNPSDFLSDKKSLLIIGIILGIIIDLEIVFGVLLALGFIFWLLINTKKKLITPNMLLLLLGISFSFLTRIIFDFKNNFLITNSLFRGGETFVEKPDMLSLWFNVVRRLELLINVFADTLTRGHEEFAIALFVFCVFALVFFYKKITFIEKRYIVLCLSLFFTFLIVLIFFVHEIWTHYFVGLPLIFILFVSLILGVLYRQNKIRSFIILFTLLLAVINLDPQKRVKEFVNPIWEGNAAVYRNQLAVVDYVYNDSLGKPFNYIGYSPAVHDYNYRYLFQWYGPKRYGYTPSSKKEELYYVIIEPNIEKPFLLKEWLEIRKNDGKIIKEETVKGGILVQTRIH